MSLSWIANRSLKVSPKARLVGDDEAAALRRKLESIEWRPSNVGSSRVDLQACKLEYSIVSPK